MGLEAAAKASGDRQLRSAGHAAGLLPVALVLPVDRRLEMAYWLYWPIYELKLCDADFHEPFSEDLEAVYGRLLGPLLPGGVAAGSEAVVGRLAA